MGCLSFGSGGDCLLQVCIPFDGHLERPAAGQTLVQRTHVAGQLALLLARVWETATVAVTATVTVTGTV